jgi:DNA-binding NarL/FixJ family response regulator
MSVPIAIAAKKRVLIVDDSVVVRKALSDILSRDADLEVAGLAANGRLALTKLQTLHPDVILLDIEMPETLQAYRAGSPSRRTRLHAGERCRRVGRTARSSGLFDHAQSRSRARSARLLRAIWKRCAWQTEAREAYRQHASVVSRAC